MTAIPLPQPTPTAVSERFWRAVQEGRLELQHCRSCGLTFHYPRVLCPSCWSADLDWQAVSGRGAVETFTVIHRSGHPAWQSRAPYVCALIRLEEGPTLLSNVVEVQPGAVRVGMGVRVVFRRDGDVVLPQFVPAVDG